MQLSRFSTGTMVVLTTLTVASALVLWGLGRAQERPEKKDAEAPKEKAEDFAAVMARMKAAKADIAKKHSDMLEKRYLLVNKAMRGVMMSGGKRAVQAGPRAKLSGDMTWEKLGGLSPDEIK